MADAFTAGVKPGGLNDTLQIRILLCYLIKTLGPLRLETIQGALLQEELVNYFELLGAMTQLEELGLVALNDDDRYTVTPKGAEVADNWNSDVPRSVRESAVRAVGQIQSWRQKEAANRARVEKAADGFEVQCAIGEMGRDILRLQIAMPDAMSAETLKNNFTARGSEVYALLMDALTRPTTPADRPPEGLL